MSLLNPDLRRQLTDLLRVGDSSSKRPDRDSKSVSPFMALPGSEAIRSGAIE
jgi:hypothetical protein